MNKQKLISALQSRVAKRRNDLKILWKKFQSLGDFTSFGYIYFIKERANVLGEEQKVDKQLLRQLIDDERELKRLRELLTEGMSYENN
jgi:hypothetical protein